MLQIWIDVSRSGPGRRVPRDCPAPFPTRQILAERISDWSLRAFVWPIAQAERAITDAGDRIVLGCGSVGASDSGAEDLGKTAATAPRPEIRVDRRGSIEVRLPPAGVVPLYGRRREAGWEISSDPRLFDRAGVALSSAGLYALLQFGALIPPFGLWKSEYRFLPGTRTALKLGADETVVRSLPAAAPAGKQPTSETPIVQRLDQVLGATCPDARPVILFSGGVDSGLLAARAAALGWTETLLVTYRMEGNEADYEAAVAIAEHLGLQLITVADDPRDWPAAFTELPQVYPHPCGDYATLPAYRLARWVVEHCGDRRTVLDGGGADALFRSFRKLKRWRRLYRLPRSARRLAGGAYRSVRLWDRDGALSRKLAAARTAARLPFHPGAVLAENPLDGIAYHFVAADRERVLTALADWIHLAFPARGKSRTPERSPTRNARRWNPASADQDRLVARQLDLLHVVSGLTAFKHAGPFLGSTLDLIHPFLHPLLLQPALGHEPEGGPHGASKEVLKRLLARQVPARWVTRSKRGMTPPIGHRLQMPAMVDLLEEHLLTRPGMLGDHLNRKAIATLCADLRRRKALPHTTYNFLWTALLTARWLRDAAGRAGGGG